jgi:hypothetical protein
MIFTSNTWTVAGVESDHDITDLAVLAAAVTVTVADDVAATLQPGLCQCRRSGLECFGSKEALDRSGHQGPRVLRRGGRRCACPRLPGLFVCERGH